MPFPQFGALPPELRIRIWEHALDDAVGGPRMIRVSVYHRLHVSQHTCVTKGSATGDDPSTFCGNVTRCDRYEVGERSQISMSMVDGFFSTSDDFPEADEAGITDGFARVGLACLDARRVVTARYPVVMRVHRGFYQLNDQMHVAHEDFWRQTTSVRCDPRSDTLLITQVPDMCAMDADGHGSLRERHVFLDKVFPGCGDYFGQFRRVLSSFENVAFAYLGDRRPRLGDAFDHDTGEMTGMDMPGSSDLPTLLLFLSSMTSLRAWPHPVYWTERNTKGSDKGSDTETVVVDDVRELRTGGYHRDWEVRHMVEEMEDLVRDQARLKTVQERHRGVKEGRWVPTLRPLDRVGCYAARSWCHEPK